MILGTTVEITSEFSEEVDSVAITIHDPLGILVVDGENMPLLSGTTYQYLFQSLEVFAPGRYSVLISAISGAYIVQDIDFFILDNF